MASSNYSSVGGKFTDFTHNLQQPSNPTSTPVTADQFCQCDVGLTIDVDDLLRRLGDIPTEFLERPNHNALYATDSDSDEEAGMPLNLQHTRLR